MNELNEFFNDLIQASIHNRQPKIDIIENNFINIKIDFSDPTEDRPNRRSKKLIFKLSEEFISDHQENLIVAIPREDLLNIINDFDFQNRTQSVNDLQPSETFVITQMGKILRYESEGS